MGGKSITGNPRWKTSGLIAATEGLNPFFLAAVLLKWWASYLLVSRTCQVHDRGNRCSALRFYFTKKWKQCQIGQLTEVSMVWKMGYLGCSLGDSRERKLILAKYMNVSAAVGYAREHHWTHVTEEVQEKRGCAHHQLSRWTAWTDGLGLWEVGQWADWLWTRWVWGSHGDGWNSSSILSSVGNRACDCWHLGKD